MQHSHPFDRLLTGSSPTPPNVARVVPGVELRRSECGERAADRSQVVPHERVGTTAALRGCLAFGLAASNDGNLSGGLMKRVYLAGSMLVAISFLAACAQRDSVTAPSPDAA